jgi:hypothetical protein
MICLSIQLSVLIHLFISLSIHLPVYLSGHPCFSSSIHLKKPEVLVVYQPARSIHLPNQCILKG